MTAPAPQREKFYELLDKKRQGLKMPGTLMLTDEQAQFLAEVIGRNGELFCVTRTQIVPAQRVLFGDQPETHVEEQRHKVTKRKHPVTEGDVADFLKALAKEGKPCSGPDIAAELAVDKRRIPEIARHAGARVTITGKGTGTRYQLADAPAGAPDPAPSAG